MLKSYQRGESSRRTLEDGLSNSIRLTEPAETAERTPSASRRSGRAMAALDADTWLQAMKSKMDSIHKNQTRELVELPVGRKLLPCKWFFRYKYVTNLEKPKYKAQLVSKSFKQEYGVNYDEIFSPVVKMSTLWLLLRVVATKGLDIEQLDVKMTFLHTDLEEDIYMSQSAGFSVTGEESHIVCPLKKSLYG